MLFYDNTSEEVHTPTLLGSLTQDKVLSQTAPLRPPEFDSSFPKKERDLVKFKFFSVDCTSFPMRKFSEPSGCGHTLLFGPNHSRVRKLSTLECWLLSGLVVDGYKTQLKTKEEWVSLFLHFNSPEFSLFGISLVAGIVQHSIHSATPQREKRKVVRFPVSTSTP